MWSNSAVFIHIFRIFDLIFFNFAKFFKIRLFVFSPIILNLLEVDTLKLLLYSFYADKRASSTPAGFQSLLELLFRKLKLDNYTNCIFIFDKLKNFVEILICFATIWTNEYFVRRAVTSELILISPCILTKKSFLDFKATRLFLMGRGKYFRYVLVFYVNFFITFKKFRSALNEWEIPITKKGGTRLYYSFRISSWFLWLWPIVFIKNFLSTFWILLSIVIFFVVQ